MPRGMGIGRTCTIGGVVIAASLSAFGFAACGSDDDMGGGDTGSGDISDTGGPAPPPPATTDFTSPSGNIICQVDAGAATCGIIDFDYPPPPGQPADCEPQSWGHVVELKTTGAAQFICQGDPPVPSAPVLAYKDSTATAGFSCRSAEDGVSCTSLSSGLSFKIAREKVTGVSGPPPPPPPSCASDITWEETADHLGEDLTVSGPVVGTSYRPDVDRAPTFINIGRDYPDEPRFTVVIFGGSRPNFDEAPEAAYLDQDVVVRGSIYDYNGTPEIEVADPGQIEIC